MIIKSVRLKNLFKNSGILFLGSNFEAVFLFLQSVIIARAIGVAEYGKWAIVLTSCGLLMNFFSLKTEDVLGKYLIDLKIDKKTNELLQIIKKTLIYDFMTKSFALLVIILLSGAISKLFNGPNNVFVFWVYGASLFLKFINSLWFGLERDNSNYKNISLFNILILFIRVLIITYFFLIMNKTNLIFLAVSFLISNIIMFNVKTFRSNILLKENFDLSLKHILFNKNKVFENKKVFQEFIGFIKTSYSSTFISTLIKKSDILVAGYFFSSESVGLLRLGKKIARIIQDTTNSVSKPLYKDFNEVIKKNAKNKIYKFLKKNFIYYVVVVFIILSIVSIFMKPFIVLVYGIEYLSSYTFFLLYMLMTFIVLISFWANPLLLALKGWNYKFKVLIVTTFFLIISIYFLKIYFGIYGVVIAYITAKMFTNTLFLVYIRKKLIKEGYQYV